ncbi:MULTISPECIES: hypothetical protein [unclassified Clostridium]|uniref:hypothetical protein n=1 Tax=unclassified Clostridium TaxID=2614128 RepID=UPI0025C115E7|nr:MULTISPECIES: hypothetical protein [unclassified Clostridium]
MADKYFKTRSYTFCMAIQYVTNKKFYKFQDKNGVTFYSFKVDENFYEKLIKLNDIKFS